jgi:acetyl esterase/lipase
MVSSRAVLSAVTPPPDLVLAYGSGPERVADVRIPQGSGPHPLVLVIHGGYWRAKYDRSHLGPMCVDLTARGYLTCAPEYHRAGHDDGGWPGTFVDVAAAVRILPTLLGELVAPQQVILVGHSAGGHLALWAASAHRASPDRPGHHREPLPVRGVLSLAGVCDLTAAARHGLDGNAAQALMGGGPGELPEEYRAADPMRLLPSGVRTILLHGDADTLVPIEIAGAMPLRHARPGMTPSSASFPAPTTST